ncbi:MULTISPECIES: Gfo/Idh/MocA family oxidoreductase [unclassified Sphingomonas]|uniref:Gfo/Idh/MocA family protein n=1 Tax=unclassified Sphingomonas TaxID=196159 RepID=UPI002269BC6C|nr:MULTISPECIES: Gfo/Idh/MocA family oxidoreductase [unclassified Sphingomonas]
MSRPRVGFLGVGWIGRHRMQAMLDTGAIEAVAVADPAPAMVAEAQALAPGVMAVESLDAMLALGVDGVVIASPSALHADQATAAFEAGVAVFCQKPLGRDAAEAARVVAAAKAADRLLGVDFSYRHTAGMEAIAALVRDGTLGPIHAVDLTFHNAYGPDKPWFYDRAQSGGGCVMDLGVHLVDLALWTLGFPAADGPVCAQLFADGRPLTGDAVEDFALASIVLATGTVVRLACSWRLHAGQDAVIEAAFYGRDGGAALRNVGGSFYDFTAERFAGTTRETLATPPDAWGGRAAAAWATRLAQSPRFDPDSETVVAVSRVLDRIYAAAR